MQSGRIGPRWALSQRDLRETLLEWQGWHLKSYKLRHHHIVFFLDHNRHFQSPFKQSFLNRINMKITQVMRQGLKFGVINYILLEVIDTSMETIKKKHWKLAKHKFCMNQMWYVKTNMDECGRPRVRAPDRTNTQGLKITEENMLPL